VSGVFGKGSVAMSEIPKGISEVQDSITSQFLTCEACNRNYKIIPQELSFYRRLTIPIPRKCPDCRHRDRLKLRNRKKMHDIKCSKCQKQILTTLDPAIYEKIYCQDCYLKEVY
jgi:uncharacterized protein YbaR (Trm112 family)